MFWQSKKSAGVAVVPLALAALTTLIAPSAAADARWPQYTCLVVHTPSLRAVTIQSVDHKQPRWHLPGGQEFTTLKTELGYYYPSGTRSIIVHNEFVPFEQWTYDADLNRPACAGSAIVTIP